MTADSPDRRAGQRADARQQPDQPAADQQREQDFRPDRPIRADEIVALQDLLDQLRVDFDPRNIRGERRRLAIVDHPGGGGPDQDDVLVDQRTVERAGQYVSRRDIQIGRRRREMHGDPAGGIRRHGQRTDAEVGHPGIRAETRLALGAGAAADIRPCASAATRSISATSDGYGLSPSFKTSGTRRTTLSQSRC